MNRRRSYEIDQIMCVIDPEHWKPRRCKCPEGYQCRIYAVKSVFYIKSFKLQDGLERWPHVCEKKYPKMPPHLRNSTQSTSPDEILDEES
jgi:hypothetical protein